MDNLKFHWDAANVRHLAEHEVTPEEAEETVLGDPMEFDFEVLNGEERWSYVGETADSRILRVVFTMRADKIRVITAFEPSALQRRIYLKWKAEQQNPSD
jgi:uncharacterized protein